MERRKLIFERLREVVPPRGGGEKVERGDSDERARNAEAIHKST